MSADPWPSMPEWDIAQWFNTGHVPALPLGAILGRLLSEA